MDRSEYVAALLAAMYRRRRALKEELAAPEENDGELEFEEDAGAAANGKPRLRLRTKSQDGAAGPAMSVADQAAGGAFVPPPSAPAKRGRLRWRRRPAAELAAGMHTKDAATRNPQAEKSQPPPPSRLCWRRKDWRGADHPRGQPENAGQFGPGGGEAVAETAATASPHKEAVATWLAASELPGEVKESYARTATAVLDKMPPGLRQAALGAIAEHGGRVTFYADVASVTAALEKETGKKERAKVGGWVKHHAGGDAVQVHLDGDGGSGAGDTAEGIYAHELGHAVDVGRKYSSDPQWAAAWKKEIKGGKQVLSRYALVSATEGFAELHRAIVQKGVEAVQAAFPKCVGFLAAKGLV